MSRITVMTLKKYLQPIISFLQDLIAESRSAEIISRAEELKSKIDKRIVAEKQKFVNGNACILVNN